MMNTPKSVNLLYVNVNFQSPTMKTIHQSESKLFNLLLFLVRTNNGCNVVILNGKTKKLFIPEGILVPKGLNKLRAFRAMERNGT